MNAVVAELALFEINMLQHGPFNQHSPERKRQGMGYGGGRNDDCINYETEHNRSLYRAIAAVEPPAAVPGEASQYGVLLY